MLSLAEIELIQSSGLTASCDRKRRDHGLPPQRVAASLLYQHSGLSQFLKRVDETPTIAIRITG